MLCGRRRWAVKGYVFYFEALSKIDKSLLEGWEIKSAGSDRQKTELKKMASNLWLNISFLGHMGEVTKLYSEAKIFTLSSRSEGLSNVLIETGAFGCARLSSDTVGAR
ncbi:glycosyltransferase family 4 protein, partial [Campylobacter concisus]|uniref:glycosyltransferase family 4 protein n=1 Tax=Campylobacter concisus TaxID=199 RepID=UPI0021563EFA